MYFRYFVFFRYYYYFTNVKEDKITRVAISLRSFMDKFHNFRNDKTFRIYQWTSIDKFRWISHKSTDGGLSSYNAYSDKRNFDTQKLGFFKGRLQLNTFHTFSSNRFVNFDRKSRMTIKCNLNLKSNIPEICCIEIDSHLNQ